ncbi:hypothetical protein [Salmonella enterica]|nr:hypothetical protein [Salmonella enterica]
MAWFFYWRFTPRREHNHEETTMVLMGIALIAAAGTELGWW